eukprot:6998532-Prymnesium_polylepis.1
MEEILCSLDIIRDERAPLHASSVAVAICQEHEDFSDGTFALVYPSTGQEVPLAFKEFDDLMLNQAPQVEESIEAPTHADATRAIFT